MKFVIGKKCPKCGNNKRRPASHNCIECEHVYMKKYRKDNMQKFALHGKYYRELHRDELKEYHRLWREKNRDTLKARQHIWYKKSYIPAPIGICPICHAKKKLHQDHNHTFGVLRDKICSKCNLALGLTGESPTILRELAAYIEKWDHACRLA